MGAEQAGPLLALAERLRSARPPSLTALIALLEPAQSYGEFARLVREYLPERELEILREPSPARQIAAFASHFQDRYFPLHDEFRGLVDDYGDLLAGIPIIPLGMGWEDYHAIPDWRLGLQVMTYVLESPYEEDEGARLVLAESLADKVPVKVLRRVPEGGLPLNEVAGLVDGTPYEGLAWRPRWAVSRPSWRPRRRSGPSPLSIPRPSAALHRLNQPHCRPAARGQHKRHRARQPGRKRGR